MSAILLSALAGIGGTGLGGILAVILGATSQQFNCWLLSFAGGVMTSIDRSPFPVPQIIAHCALRITH